MLVTRDERGGSGRQLADLHGLVHQRLISLLAELADLVGAPGVDLARVVHGHGEALAHAQRRDLDLLQAGHRRRRDTCALSVGLGVSAPAGDSGPAGGADEGTAAGAQGRRLVGSGGRRSGRRRSLRALAGPQPVPSQGSPDQPEGEHTDRHDWEDPTATRSTARVLGDIALRRLHLGHRGQRLKPVALRLRLRRCRHLRLGRRDRRRLLSRLSRLSRPVVHSAATSAVAPEYAIKGRGLCRRPVHGRGLLNGHLLLSRRVPGRLLRGISGRCCDLFELRTLLGRPGVSGGKGLLSTLRTAADEPQHPVPVEHPVIHGPDLSSTSRTDVCQ